MIRRPVRRTPRHRWVLLLAGVVGPAGGLAAAASVVPAGVQHGAVASPATPRRELSRVFRGNGGPVTATVTVRGAGPAGCPVALMGPSGAVLAATDARTGPVILRADAEPGATIILELRPPRRVSVGWEAAVVGVAP